MQDTTATVTWLAIIACCSVLQTTALLVGGLVVWRRWRTAEQRVHAIERDHLLPLLARLELTLADMQDAVSRLRQADDDVRRAWRIAADVGGAAIRRAEAWSWPLQGAIKGVQAAARVLLRSDRARPKTLGERVLDERDRLRFVGEGGRTNA